MERKTFFTFFILTLISLHAQADRGQPCNALLPSCASNSGSFFDSAYRENHEVPNSGGKVTSAALGAFPSLTPVAGFFPVGQDANKDNKDMVIGPKAKAVPVRVSEGFRCFGDSCGISNEVVEYFENDGKPFATNPLVTDA